MKILEIFTLLLCGLLTACSRGPEPIQYGKEACTHCKMTIMDKRFATEIITAKGKVYKFDSVECMAAFLKDNPDVADNSESNFLINDYNHPGAFYDARKAWFLHDVSLASPMGANLGAFISRGAAEGEQRDQTGKIYNWSTLLEQQR